MPTKIRSFVDGGYGLTIAIKQRPEELLLDRFLAFWQKHHGDIWPVSMGAIRSILSKHAVENFNHDDWAYHQELLNDLYTHHRHDDAPSAGDMVNIILSVIFRTKMTMEK